MNMFRTDTKSISSLPTGERQTVNPQKKDIQYDGDRLVLGIADIHSTPFE